MAPSAGRHWVEVDSSPGFANWLEEQNVSLAFTTYQTSKLFVLGRFASGRLHIFERTFPRCMGLWSDGQTLWLSSLYQLWRLENVLRPGDTYQGHDRVYLPRIAHTTGKLNIHDIARDAGGRVVFVATLFGCLATLSERHSFTPLWKPPFLGELVAEDRCHLNGLALEDGRPRYVTLVSPSDIKDGWRTHRHDGGCVLEVPSGRVVGQGLSMPHSPRVYRDRLWLLNSGTGMFGSIERDSGTFTPLTFCPGFLRGLDFVGDYAVAGLSRPRNDKTFEGLPLDAELSRRKTESRCGLHIINLRSGETAHWLHLAGVINELYDVAVLPGVTRPMLVGVEGPEIERTISLGDESAL
jgi:uncharacterized protein (TIGR03032 family)